MKHIKSNQVSKLRKRETAYLRDKECFVTKNDAGELSYYYPDPERRYAANLKTMVDWWGQI